MPIFLRSLSIPVLLAALLAVSPGRTLAQPAPPRGVQAQAQNMANGMGKALRVLREDIDVDLPDNRGAALGEVVDRCVAQVRQLQRATRSEATAGQLHRLVVELDKELDRLVAASTRLGSDAYYLTRSAANINAQNEALARLLAPPTIPQRVFTLTEQIGKGLRALRDDIDVDLPDARGAALSAVADRCLGHLRFIHRGERFGATPDQLRKHIIELNRDLDKLQDSTTALGADGYYLRKSIAQLQVLSRELLKALGSP